MNGDDSRKDDRRDKNSDDRDRNDRSGRPRSRKDDRERKRGRRDSSADSAASDATIELPPRFDPQGRRKGDDPLADKLETILSGWLR